MRNFVPPVLLALTLAFAAQTAQAQSRTELARQYVALPGVQAMLREMFAPEAMYQQVRNTFPKNVKISNSKKRRIGKVLSQGMMQILPAMNKTLAREAARSFTKAELKAMIAFYSTPEGASILSKTTSLTTRSIARMAPNIEAVKRAVTPAIIRILKD